MPSVSGVNNKPTKYSLVIRPQRLTKKKAIIEQKFSRDEGGAGLKKLK